MKKDTFGEIRLVSDAAGRSIVRDARPAPLWARGLARWLLRREATALTALQGIDGVPELVSVERDTLRRYYIAGDPLYRARTRDPRFFRAAAKLLRRMHAAGVVHNDLAKEPNLLVDEDGNPAFVDYQLAWFAPRRNRLFRVLGREDLRHLLKHKRTYCPEKLTAREKRILDEPALVSRLWAASVKRAYLFVTRRILGWSDREGCAERTTF